MPMRVDIPRQSAEPSCSSVTLKRKHFTSVVVFLATTIFLWNLWYTEKNPLTLINVGRNEQRYVFGRATKTPENISTTLLTTKIPGTTSTTLLTTKMLGTTSTTLLTTKMPVTTSTTLLTTKMPVATSTTLLTTKMPVTTSTTLLTTKIPETKSTTLFTTKMPVTTSTTTKMPVTTSTTLITTKMPGTTSSNIPTIKMSDTTSATVHTTKMPDTTSATLHTTKMPDTTSTTLLSTKMPVTTSTTLLTKKMPETTSTTLLTTKTPGTTSTTLLTTKMLNTTSTSSALKCTDEFRKQHLLTTGLIGRTGNILFQMATIIGIAKRTCYTPVCPKRFLHHFDSIFTLKNVDRRDYNLSLFHALGEPGCATYDDEIKSKIKPDYNWTLHGYRQSVRYFEDNSDLVRSSFVFKDTIKRNVSIYLNDKKFYKTKVCLHVRRGDMLNLLHYFNVSDAQFISRALVLMEKIIRPDNFSLIVASEDIAWCKENIKKDYVHYSPFKDAGKDLYLLTQCDHMIITSGSFGWMGAWLNETGLVVYDRKLSLYPGCVQRSDYFPSHWVGI